MFLIYYGNKLVEERFKVTVIIHIVRLGTGLALSVNQMIFFIFVF